MMIVVTAEVKRILSSNWQEIVGLRVTLYDADGPARSFSGFSV